MRMELGNGVAKLNYLAQSAENNTAPFKNS